MNWIPFALALLVPMPAEVAYVPPMRGPIVRHYEAPPTPYSPGHRGIDIGSEYGTTVVASAGGIVAFAGSVGGEKFVSIEHDDGIRTTYSFLSRILVHAKQTVAQKQPIAESGLGHPGSTLPPHLHFGAKRGDEYLDPELLLLEGFKHDYSALVRLVPTSEPSGAGRVGAAFAPLAVLVPVWRARRKRAGSRGTRRLSHEQPSRKRTTLSP